MTNISSKFKVRFTAPFAEGIVVPTAINVATGQSLPGLLSENLAYADGSNEPEYYFRAVSESIEAWANIGWSHDTEDFDEEDDETPVGILELKAKFSKEAMLELRAYLGETFDAGTVSITYYTENLANEPVFRHVFDLTGAVDVVHEEGNILDAELAVNINFDYNHFVLFADARVPW